MNETSIAQHITGTFPNVETAESFGYTFFFYGADHKRPFATLAASDNDYDRVSNLDHPGVYRLNIGVSRATFRALFPPVESSAATWDYTALDRLMPHPVYAAQCFLCVLNPDTTLATVQELLAEAYDITRSRNEKGSKEEEPH